MLPADFENSPAGCGNLSAGFEKKAAGFENWWAGFGNQMPDFENPMVYFEDWMADFENRLLAKIVMQLELVDWPICLVVESAIGAEGSSFRIW